MALTNHIEVNDEWERASDQMTEQRIESELWWSPFVDSDEIRVSVEAGAATLTGQVDDWFEASAAVKNAWDGGAFSVESRLTIKGSDRPVPLDTWRHPDFSLFRF